MKNINKNELIKYGLSSVFILSVIVSLSINIYNTRLNNSILDSLLEEEPILYEPIPDDKTIINISDLPSDIDDLVFDNAYAVEEELNINDIDTATPLPKSQKYLILVNKTNKLNSSFVPENIRNLNIPFVGAIDSNRMEAGAGLALERMFLAAKEDGVILQGRSGYRSYNTQKINYNNKVSAMGQEQADKYVAKPGFSEHQTGLVMDIVTPGYNKLDSGFKNTSAYKWLINNCADFGFILRYPEGKSNITGYNFEPWHYRYVGVEHAKIIMSNNLTLEQYLSDYANNSENKTPSIPNNSDATNPTDNSLNEPKEENTTNYLPTDNESLPHTLTE